MRKVWKKNTRGKREGRASIVVDLVENAMKNLNIDLEAACDALGINIEEYLVAKNGKQA